MIYETLYEFIQDIDLSDKTISAPHTSKFIIRAVTPFNFKDFEIIESFNSKGKTYQKIKFRNKSGILQERNLHNEIFIIYRWIPTENKYRAISKYPTKSESEQALKVIK